MGASGPRTGVLSQLELMKTYIVDFTSLILCECEDEHDAIQQAEYLMEHGHVKIENVELQEDEE